jgi:hypothetical protein
MSLLSALRALFGIGSASTTVRKKKHLSSGRGTFVKHEPPEGMACRYRDVAVAGISHRADVGCEFVFGSNLRLVLEREPTNPVDSNAIRVIGVWQHRGIEKRELIGYVPRDTAARIASRYPHTDIRAVPIVVFQPDSKHRTPGVRFDIYTPRVKRKVKSASSN